MNMKYPIENKYMKCVLHINEFNGLRPRVRSNRQVGLGQVKGRDREHVDCAIQLANIL